MKAIYQINRKEITHIQQRLCLYGLLFSLLLIGASCKKLVSIPPARNTITTSEVFADSASADAGVLGIYLDLNGSAVNFGNGGSEIYTGMSSDEILGTNIGTNSYIQYNSLTALNSTLTNTLWPKAYNIIYQANSCIEGLQASTTIPTATKSELVAESKFLRALCYYYLVNLFGDVPYVTTTSYQTNNTIAKTSQKDIYQTMMADLKSLQGQLPADYSSWEGQRIRATQGAATALLARVYLSTGDWADAVKASSVLIANSGTYSLVSNLNNVFMKNSQEAILQWNINTTTGTATAIGRQFIPLTAANQPNYYLTPMLLNAFENGDQRKTAWTTTATYRGNTYQYPYKYKIGARASIINGNATECYTVLRLGEQYLIRAEANAQLGNIDDAIADLNTIRNRAGLPGLSASLNQMQVLAAVAQERRIELFTEGDRWIYLKRTNAIDAVMTVETPLKGGNTTWKSYQQLYPIPYTELQTDPNLTQNLGY